MNDQEKMCTRLIKGKHLLDCLHKRQLQLEQFSIQQRFENDELSVFETEVLLTSVQEYYLEISCDSKQTHTADEKFIKLRQFLLEINIKRLVCIVYSIVSCLHGMLLLVLKIVCKVNDSNTTEKLLRLFVSVFATQEKGCILTEKYGNVFVLSEHYAAIHSTYRSQKVLRLKEKLPSIADKCLQLSGQKIQDLIIAGLLEDNIKLFAEVFSRNLRCSIRKSNIGTTSTKSLLVKSCAGDDDIIDIVKAEWEEVILSIVEKYAGLSDISVNLSKIINGTRETHALKSLECMQFTEKLDQKAYHQFLVHLIINSTDLVEDSLMWEYTYFNPCPLSLCNLELMNNLGNIFLKLLSSNSSRLKLLIENGLFHSMISTCDIQHLYTAWDLHTSVLIFTCWNSKTATNSSCFYSLKQELINSFEILTQFMKNMTNDPSTEKYYLLQLGEQVHILHLQAILIDNWIRSIKVRLEVALKSWKFSEYVEISCKELPKIFPLLQLICLKESSENIFEDVQNHVKDDIVLRVQNIVFDVKELEKTSLSNLEDKLKHYCDDFFSSNLPRGKYWKVKDTLNNPSNFMQILAGNIKEIVNSIQIISEDRQIILGGLFVLCVCQSLIKAFKKNKQSFSQGGARQLEKDLNYFKNWILQQENVCINARQWMIDHDSMKECLGIVKLLLRLNGFAIGGNKITPSEDSIPLEIFVTNQNYWLSRRVKGSKKCCC